MTHVSISSQILVRELVLINFILLNVCSVVVEHTEIVKAPITRYIIMENACCNAKTQKDKSTIFFDFDCLSIGFST